jgi:subtilase family serine protease
MAGNQNLGKMILMLAPSAEQDAAAAKAVAALHDPSSASFHKWFIPAEFGRQFGVDEADKAQVQQWLQSQGLAVHEVSQRSEPVLIRSLLPIPETRASAQPPVS